MTFQSRFLLFFAITFVILTIINSCSFSNAEKECKSICLPNFASALYGDKCVCDMTRMYK